MATIGQLKTTDSIEKAMRDIRDWLSKIGVNGMNVDLRYDARGNSALVRFKHKDKEYEFRSTNQKNCRLNMHGIARVMEFKVRASLMGIEKFESSMQAYTALPNYSSIPNQEQAVPSSEKSYSALGLTSLESNDEIRHRYRTLCKTFHPDMAVSEEAKKEFQRRFTEINQAYQDICKERGI